MSAAAAAKDKAPEKKKMECFRSNPEENEVPPVSITKSIERKKPATEVLSQELNPGMAFEKFAGRVYDTSGADYSDSVAKSQLLHVGSRRTDYTSFASAQRSFESPLDRYNRLRSEVKQFQEDLAELAKQASSKAPDPIREVSDLISKDLAGLERDLTTVMSDDRVKPFLQSSYPSDAASVAERDLTSKLLGELQRFGAAEAKAAKPKEKAQEERPTIELFYAGGAGERGADLSALDKRVAGLEATLGAISDSSPPFSDVQSGLRQLAKKVELLDPTKLDAISKKIKTLVADLDALEEKRAAAKGQKASPYEDKVQQLYTMMSRWDKSAQSLPKIVARLQTLRDVHEEAASHVVRVQAVEKQSEAIERLLQDDAALLKKLDEQFAANVKTMQSNVAMLEQRFAELAKKVDKKR